MIDPLSGLSALWIRMLRWLCFLLLLIGATPVASAGHLHDPASLSAAAERVELGQAVFADLDRLNVGVITPCQTDCPMRSLHHGAGAGTCDCIAGCVDTFVGIGFGLPVMVAVARVPAVLAAPPARSIAPPTPPPRA